MLASIFVLNAALSYQDQEQNEFSVEIDRRHLLRRILEQLSNYESTDKRQTQSKATLLIHE